MAVKALTRTDNPNGAANCVLAVWVLANGDTGSPIEAGDFADCSVQIEGLFGVGGSVTFEGSNDGANYRAMTDPQGNAVTKTAASLEVLEENTRYKRPNCTAGDGTTALTVTMWGRRNR